jgi:cytochrome c oxidase subunit I
VTVAPRRHQDPQAGRPLWRRMLSPHLGTGIVLGIGGFYLGWYGGHWLVNGLGPASLAYFGDIDQNDLSLFLGYILGVVGFLVGLGFGNYPLARLRGYPPSLREKEEPTGIGRYFRLNTDHKVVGMQYFVGIGLFFFVAGLNAMLIRFELLRPEPNVWPAGNYLTLVTEHGTMMMGMMTSGILGPFANYFLPLMIGARRMAFPRIEALTFWLLMAAGAILLSGYFYGGIPTGWTGYQPLNDQANLGMDAYIMFFALVGLSMTLLGLNMLATVITMRAPGMTWTRLPIFVWGVIGTSALMLLAAPVLISVLTMSAFDRTIQTGFFVPAQGGTGYLFENLFWFFGHPEVYILALPGFGIVLELMPVFARKPLWGYRLAVAGMLGVTLLSWMVWQHHIFVSGINSDLRPFYMLSTELISIPTGFIFVCAMGTLWRGQIRYSVPMLFCLGWVFNFLFGGLSGVFLSDVPSDVDSHGSFFSMAHFHYTIMGGLIFAFFAGIYYWLPKMTGFMLNERLGKIHFWMMFIAFNSTFGPLFALGFMGMARRVVTYPSNLQPLNDWVSASAFVLGISMLVFLYNLVYSQLFAREPAGANPWGSKSLEFQLPSPVPVHDFDRIPVIVGDPYGYGEEGAVVARPSPVPVPAGGST